MNQNMVYIALCMLVLIHVAIQEAAASTVPTSASDTAPSGECRDVLQGYLTGQLTSALGSLQVENLRKEFQRIIENQNADIERLQSTVADLKLRPNETARDVNVVYTRWGRSTCPDHAETVYSGYTGGSYHDHSGGAAEPVCLPPDPEWGLHTNAVDGYKGYMFGAEYEYHTLTDSRKDLKDYNVPCAVCKVHKRSSLIMIPARRSCYSGWNLEYSGYLNSGGYSHPRSSQYTCIDEHPDVVEASQASSSGYLFYLVEARTGSLPSPPYSDGKELTCVVCSS